ncbi:hypothetical protein E3N88_21708 [Mikania micrantha]|uniref:Uncharacterized protein n=1 Tax=Mikania micrantha TaxID=192012 RepID=A0A5N6N9W0_9ASTR|nr:hypothetical protein E3N88_21708 [Mikania micrantha]
MASPASGVKPQKFEPEIVQKALVNMVIMDGLPFSVVSQDEIKNIMETEFPDFQFPSSEKISRICTQLFMDEKLNEKRFFKALELSWNYTTYWGNVEDSNMLIYIASILDPRKKTDCMELYFLNGKYKHDYNDEGEPLWKKKAEFVVAATYDLFNVYAGKIRVSHQTANFRTSGYMSYLYHDTGPRGLFQKREVGFGVELFDDCCADLAAGVATMKFLVFLFLLLLLDELAASDLTSGLTSFAAVLVSVFLYPFLVSVPFLT